MCRLFGYKGISPTKLSFFLVDATNALAKQSILDSRNISNSQGWGIGFYQNHKAFIQKRASSASFDFNFKFLTEFIETDTMVAHIRDATVGEISDHNAHPFLYYNWIFAHNGHVSNFDLIRPLILQKIGPELAFEILGSTDSEYMFFLFISILRKEVSDITSSDIETAIVRDALSKTIQQINSLCADVGTTEPNKINLIVTNGNVMVASRYGHSLYYAAKKKMITHDVKLFNESTNLSIRFNNPNNSLTKGKNESVVIASET
ncbi:MAG: class II glutamine amidotransferase, partial [Cyanobacteriota bacterium]